MVEPDAAAPKPENGEAPETVSLTLASLAQTAEVLLKQGGMGGWDGGKWGAWRLQNLDLESDRLPKTNRAPEKMAFPKGDLSSNPGVSGASC